LNDAVTATATYVFGAQTIAASTQGGAGLTVYYDAANQTYTLNMGTGAESFGPSSITGTTAVGTLYSQTTSLGTDKLTLDTNFSRSETPYPYAGIGIWQQAISTPGGPGVDYTTFVYGMQTPQGGLPLSGEASYVADMVGYTTPVSGNVRSIIDQSFVEFDFQTGTFKITGNNPTEFDTTANHIIDNVGITFLATGRLFNSSTAFTGSFVFQDSNGIYRGTVDGRLYGPVADDFGASFYGYGSAGAIVGSFLGPQLGTPSDNLSLVDIAVQQQFPLQSAQLYTNATNSSGLGAAVLNSADGQLTLSPDGTVILNSPNSSLFSTTFGPANIAAPTRPNFTSYQETLSGRPVELDLYNVGPGNSELALTYMDLGIWSQGAGTNAQPDKYQLFSTFGVVTPPNILKFMSGTAQYAGVVYGAAVDGQSNRYDVTGSSAYNVDFTLQSVTGSLTLQGAGVGSSASANFGSFTFSGPLSFSGQNLTITQSGVNVGQLANQFYGPAADETGGSFNILLKGGSTAGGTTIVGATAAKKQ
jgi:hypothetical protein